MATAITLLTRYLRFTRPFTAAVAIPIPSLPPAGTSFRPAAIRVMAENRPLRPHSARLRGRGFYSFGAPGALGAPGTRGAPGALGTPGAPGVREAPGAPGLPAPPAKAGASGNSLPHCLQTASAASFSMPHSGHFLGRVISVGLKHITQHSLSNIGQGVRTSSRPRRAWRRPAAATDSGALCACRRRGPNALPSNN